MHLGIFFGDLPYVLNTAFSDAPSFPPCQRIERRMAKFALTIRAASHKITEHLGQCLGPIFIEPGLESWHLMVLDLDPWPDSIQN
jgi:hypothetical protein